MRQYPPEELGLSISHSLDHVLAVRGVEKKLTRFGIGYELNEVCIATNAKEELIFVDTKHATEVSKGQGGVVLDLESVGELVGRSLGRA